ncbi:hypothetical protein [Bifidobacterium sp. ESL0790]|nr:hypothetical protein [Bifidobacterium sp. ESL0790]WEV72136.1 hypothetical protein OZY47_06765 [Bifidobacterium sp. ESL0790]
MTMDNSGTLIMQALIITALAIALIATGILFVKEHHDHKNK